MSKTIKSLKRVISKNVVLLLISLTLTLIIIWSGGEIILRSLVPYRMDDTQSIYIQSKNIIMNKELKPGYQGIYYGRPVKINSLGFRDYEYGIGKSEGVYRIIILGDSMCFGPSLMLEDIYPKVLERNLSSHLPYNTRNIKRIEVLNFAVPGYNTKQELELLKTKAIFYKPDLIILNYHLNDIELNEIKVAKDKQPLPMLAALRAKSYFVNYILNHTVFLFRRMNMRGGYVSKFCGAFTDNNEFWQENQRDLLNIKKITEDNNARLLIVVIPFLVDLTSYYPLRKEHAIVGDFFESHGMATLDLLPYFLGRKATSLWINPLDGHPNKTGHKIMADAVEAYIITRILK